MLGRRLGGRRYAQVLIAVAFAAIVVTDLACSDDAGDTASEAAPGVREQPPAPADEVEQPPEEPAPADEVEQEEVGEADFLEGSMNVSDFQQSIYAEVISFAERQDIEYDVFGIRQSFTEYSLSMIRPDPAGDFAGCGPSDAVGADILGVAAGQEGNRVTAAVWMAQPPTVSDTQFSFAVRTTAIRYDGSHRVMGYEVHGGQYLIGELDADGNLDSASDAEITINETAVVFSFDADPGDPFVLLFVEGFNLPADGDAIGCDTAIAAADPFPLPASERTGNCTENDITACLNSGRFSVQVLGPDGSKFNTAASERDTAVFVDDQSAGLIRVVNGCETNGNFWVFADGFESGDTSAWSTVTVTDTATNQAKAYTPPLGQRSGAITDTSAFATCP